VSESSFLLKKINQLILKIQSEWPIVQKVVIAQCKIEISVLKNSDLSGRFNKNLAL
jgi:hypothetical protein